MIAPSDSMRMSVVKCTTPHPVLYSLAAAALVVGASLLTPALAQAQAPEGEEEYLKKSPLEEGGAVVRRKLLFRSTRFEAAPLVGFTLADPFSRNILVGANLSFHLTNSFGIGVTGGFGVANLPTDLRTNIQEQVPEDQRQDIAFSNINWLASVEGSYVPIFGKMSIMDGAILNYDLHLIFGVGFVGQGADPGVENGQPLDALENIEGGTVAPMVGFGGRFYVNDFISINVELRDYIYSSVLISAGDNDPELRNNLMLSAGASFFLPTAVKVSR